MAKPTPIHPGHAYADTEHISFLMYKQQTSPAPFGYEHFVSLPPTYDSSANKRWPLIFFLHGAGESQRGKNDSYASLRHGVPKIILCYDRLKAGKTPQIGIPSREKRLDPNDMSGRPVPAEICELVAEQFITVTPSLDMTNGYGWNSKVLTALLDEIVQHYRVDLDAIHVTGFSMGGFGTWRLGIETPNRFATLMPICGGGEAALAKNTKHIPQWVHHGELDDTVPISQSVQMVEALRRAGANDIQFTRYPDTAHDCWTAAYGNIESFQWMHSKRRTVSGEEVVIPEQNKARVA